MQPEMSQAELAVLDPSEALVPVARAIQQHLSQARPQRPTQGAVAAAEAVLLPQSAAAAGAPQQRPFRSMAQRLK